MMVELTIHRIERQLLSSEKSKQRKTGAYYGSILSSCLGSLFTHFDPIYIELGSHHTIIVSSQSNPKPTTAMMESTGLVQRRISRISPAGGEISSATRRIPRILLVLVALHGLLVLDGSILITTVQATAVAASSSMVPFGGASGPPSASTATPSAPVAVTPGVESEGGGGGSSSSNMIVSLFGYLKDSMVRTVTGCGQLWTNHGKCNEIRQKQKKYRMQIQEQWEGVGLYEDESPKEIEKRLAKVQGGISFAEFRFLQQGKEDRGKVFNLAFLVWGAPRFLPYALMLNPEMLPSPFQAENKASALKDWPREQAQAVLTTLLTLEQQVASATTGGIFSFFGKKGQQRKQQVLERVAAETESFLGQDPRQLASPSQVLERLQPHLYKTDTVDYSRAEQRLCQVPPCVVQGLARAVSGQGGLPGVMQQLTPAFLQRGKLVGHLQKVAAADDFLVQAEIDLSTVSKRVLQEICQERLLCTSANQQSPEEMRMALADWLQRTVQEPAAMVQKLQSTLPSSSTMTAAVNSRGGDNGDDQSGEEEAAVAAAAAPLQVYYNGNLARMALLAYNGCAMARNTDGSSRPSLTKLLYTGGNGSSSKSKLKSSTSSSTPPTTTSSNMARADTAVSSSDSTKKASKKSRIPFRK